MSEKDIVLKRYFSDNERFSDLINGIAFGGRMVVHTNQIEEKETVSSYQKDGRVFKRERDIIKKISDGSKSIYIACENQMEIHYGMPFRTLLYNGLTYDEQMRKCKKRHKENRDLKGSSEFLSGMKKDEKLMAVVTFVCYYGHKEWDSHLSLKEIVKIPRGFQDLGSYLADYPINLVPMMKIDPNVFHGELRELIKLLQCNMDIQKIEETVRCDSRCRYLSEETFEVFMVLSDVKMPLKRLKKMVKFKQEGKVEYDMCRAFEQLEARGEARGEERINQLYTMLFSEKRYDELEKAMADKEYR
ncbi:MAG: Rpn family recombination-promoting nuclease/putative transposase, partial [Lachnospiraceae bacterium]|nr:Rpn family recombination-promoting nuclease/putative transposase [Lachnospiraceae bacterium]